MLHETLAYNLQPLISPILWPPSVFQDAAIFATQGVSTSVSCKLMQIGQSENILKVSRDVQCRVPGSLPPKVYTATLS